MENTTFFSPGILFIICGPSGGGKTTLMKEVLSWSFFSGQRIEPVITYTTRVPRPGEEHGKDYFFVSLQDFYELQQKDFFLEVTQVGASYYGTSRVLIENLNKGINYIAVLDRNGVKSLQRYYKHVYAFWVCTSSFMDLEKRLMVRGDMSHEIIESRMVNAKEEISKEENGPVCHFKICNDNLMHARIEIIGVIKNLLCEKSLISCANSSAPHNLREKN